MPHTASPKATTDPTGKCFISYRRSHLDDVTLLMEALLDRGVPLWQDRRDLRAQPLGDALETALGATDTCGCLVWISADFAESAVIREIEAPLIVQRTRTDPAFFAEFWLADGLEYEQATQSFQPSGLVEDLSNCWSVERAETVQAIDEKGREVRRIDSREAARIATRVLERRLATVHSTLDPDEPIRVLFNAHAEAGEAFVPGCAIHLNWARHFQLRHAPPDIWSERLLPSLRAVLAAVRAQAPGRRLLVEGRATIASCLALGRVFREVTGIPVTWVQQPSGSHWTLSEPVLECGFEVLPLHGRRAGAHDLAVFASLTGDVEPAVTATPGLPGFQGVLTVRPRDGSSRRDLIHPGEATHLAKMIAASIRDARARLRSVERTHLFFAGPAGVALMLGQQLNALGPVQTYEHDQSTSGRGSYRPAALLAETQPEPRT